MAADVAAGAPAPAVLPVGSTEAVALFGADVAAGIMNHVPILENIFSMFKEIYDKYGARKDMLEWLRALEQFVTYLAELSPSLATDEDKNLMDNSLKAVKAEIEACFLERGKRLLEPEGAIEKLRDLCQRMTTTATLINLRLNMPKQQHLIPRRVAVIPPAEVDVQDLIGRGMFAVHKGQWRQMDRDRRIAIKGYFDTQNVQAKLCSSLVSGWTKVQNCKWMPRTAMFFASLGFAWIIQSLQILIMEYMPLGSLQRALFPEEGCPDDARRAHVTLTGNREALMRLLLGLTSGVQYMHAHNPPVLHLDLKTANVLLQKLLGAPDSGRDDAIDVRPLVCDFDASNEFREFRSEYASTNIVNDLPINNLQQKVCCSTYHQ